jgi:hypothetical protein
MKEATGELNSTLVVVIAVGVLAAFFYYTLWPILDNNFKANSNCSKAWCYSCAKEPSKCTNTTQTCNYGKSKDGVATDSSKDIVCPRKE